MILMDPNSELRHMPLGNASLTWDELIIPGLHTQSGSVAQFSDTAVLDLQQLDTIVSGLKPNSSLPADTKAKALNIFQQLADRTQLLRMTSDKLLSLIANFAAVIKGDDADRRQDQAARGDSWDAFFGSIDTVENAIEQSSAAGRRCPTTLTASLRNEFSLPSTFWCRSRSRPPSWPSRMWARRRVRMPPRNRRTCKTTGGRSRGDNTSKWGKAMTES